MLILLPGLMCDASYYAAQTAAFPDSIAIDSYEGADSLEKMAALVLDRAPDRFDVFGHSMGGRVALEVFRMAPERVRRLALVSTGVHGTKPGEQEKRYALRQIGRDQGMEALVNQWLPPMVAPAHHKDEELMTSMRDMCVSAGLPAFEAQIEALLHRGAQESLLPEITCPTLVMTGELDAWASPAQHEEFAREIPNAELVIVPGAGHMIMPEAPEAVNAAIASWLSQPVND